MKFSRGARLVLAAALVASLGPKLALSRPAPDTDPQLFAKRAIALLSAQGFTTRLEHRPFGTILYAITDTCRLMLADYPPHGTVAEPLSLIARPVGPLRYLWNGEVIEAPPKLWPLTSFLIQRELRRMGFSPPRRTLIAVAGSNGCDLKAIDWRKLATLPR